MAGDSHSPPNHLATLKANDDAFHALICALMARLASLPGGPTCPYRGTYTQAQMDLFRSEGWIHLPPPDTKLGYLNPASVPLLPPCQHCEI